MHLPTTTLIFAGRFAEGYAIANDLEQAQGTSSVPALRSASVRNRTLQTFDEPLTC
jgi:hypothetical protein